MQYQVVYDVENAWPNAWFVPVFIAGMMVVATVNWLRGKRQLTHNFEKPNPPAFVFIFLGAVLFLTFSLTFVSLISLRYQVAHNKASLIEGVVSGFHPADSEHSTETFQVEGHVFSYSRHSFSQGYNALYIFGGAVHEGVRVRIVYIDNNILKLEVAN